MRRELPSLFRAIGAPLLAVCAVGMIATAQAKEPIAIVVDRAKVMHISRPADTIIIGNPAIADATIQDSQTLIITGRSYGQTNLIVLDSEGQPIADEVLSVEATDEAVVTVFRRSSRVTLSCTPQCAPTLTIGDTGDFFDGVNNQIGAHNSRTDASGN